MKYSPYPWVWIFIFQDLVFILCHFLKKSNLNLLSASLSTKWGFGRLFYLNFLPATLQWLLPVTYKQDTEKICEVTWSLSYSLNVPSLIAQHMVVGSEWSAVTGCRHGTFIFCRGILMQIGCQFLAFTYYGKFVNLFCFFLLFFHVQVMVSPWVTYNQWTKRLSWRLKS